MPPIPRNNRKISCRGVYAITNTANGKVYVGSTSKTFKGRWSRHQTDLRSGRHGNRHLQAAWEVYRETAFVFTVLQVCIPQQRLDAEQYWIDRLGTHDQDVGYNIGRVAGAAMSGRHHSQEAKSKISAASKEMWKKDGHRERWMAANVGRKRSPEVGEKISKAKKGKKQSAEHTAKHAAALRGRKTDPYVRLQLSDLLRKRMRIRRKTDATNPEERREK